MTPRPSGQTVGMVHVGSAELPEAELARLAHQTWRCATCGHAESDTDLEQLRTRAQRHVQLHAQTVAAD